MAKKEIVLTEQDLHALVEDAVKTYLINEDMDEGVWSGMKNVARGLGNGNFHMMQNYRSGSYAGSIQKYGQQAQNALSQFKNILDKSGSQQIGQQVQTISQELGKIMANYQQIATQASNKQSVQQAADNAQQDAQGATAPQGGAAPQQGGAPQGAASNQAPQGATAPQGGTAPQAPKPYPMGGSMGNAARQAAVNQQQQNTQQQQPTQNTQPQQPTQNVGAAASMNSRSPENFNNQYANMQKMKFGESKKMKITQNDLRKLVSETVNKLLKEAVNELDPRTYASARDKQNAIDADYDKQMADYNKKNPLSRMMSKKPEMPRGYGRSQKFNGAAVDAFNRDYGHDWSNPNSTKHQTMGKSGNVTQYSQLGDSTFTTDYDFDARQAKAGVEPTGRGRGVVTSGGWNNKTHQNFAPTKRGMTYSDADYTLRSGANKPNFFDKGIKVADQMANGTGKYQNGKWQ